MEVHTLLKSFILLSFLAVVYNATDSLALPASSLEDFEQPDENPELPAATNKTSFFPKMAKKKAPSVPSAPLDVNENIHHTLDELNQILGSAGGASSGLVMGLTGISITDCAGSVKGKDLNSMSCQEFLTTLSECDSLANIKPLLQQAAKNKKKSPKSKKPCFK